MLLLVWMKGFLMGLAIAAPVGPIALLCIRRTLTYGRQIGLLSGCGAATADALYGIVAAFGLSVVSDALIEHSDYLRVVGGLFLCYLGLKTFFAKTQIADDQMADSQTTTEPRINASTTADIAPDESKQISFSTISAYSSTLMLTLTNPATILSFLAIFAGLGITTNAYQTSVTLVFGVFTGSMAWWLMLVSGVATLRRRLTAERLIRFNRFSSKVFGVLILGFGIAALVI